MKSLKNVDNNYKHKVTYAYNIIKRGNGHMIKYLKTMVLRIMKIEDLNFWYFVMFLGMFCICVGWKMMNS